MNKINEKSTVNHAPLIIATKTLMACENKIVINEYIPASLVFKPKTNIKTKTLIGPPPILNKALKPPRIKVKPNNIIG